MEFQLTRGTGLEFKIRYSNRSKIGTNNDPITRVRISNFYHFHLDPILGKSVGGSYGIYYGEKGTQLFRETSSKLLFGETGLAEQLKRGSSVPMAVHLTLNRFNTGLLKIETKLAGDADVFGGLYNFQESLPPNSMEFILKLKSFERMIERGGARRSRGEKLDFKAKGLKLVKQIRRGSANLSLEMEDLRFPEAIWWKDWRDGGVTFYGRVQINLELDNAAVNELYKKYFGRGGGPLASELDTQPDAYVVILVGGNEDMEQGIKCHKSILTEMSPVFETMFEIPMTERREGILRIKYFSEACVRALIEFGYQQDLERALNSSEVAMELLQVADKYEIKELEKPLLQIIISKPCSWFSVDAAINLFGAGYAVEGLADAKKKAGIALKWYAKKHPEQFNESQKYVSLCENPGKMMGLGVEALKIVPSGCTIN